MHRTATAIAQGHAGRVRQIVLVTEDLITLTAEDDTPLALELFIDTLAVFIRENHQAAWRAFQRIPGPERRDRLNEIAAMVVQVAVTQMSQAP